MYIATPFIITKGWKQPKCPSPDEWIKVPHIHRIEYYFTIERNRVLAEATT